MGSGRPFQLGGLTNSRPIFYASGGPNAVIGGRFPK